MKKKLIGIIVDALLITSALGFVSPFVVAFTITDEAKADMLFMVSWGLFFGCGILALILIAVGGINFEKHGAPDIFTLKYKDYDELKAYLEERMVRYHYIDKKTHAEDICTIDIYAEEFVWDPFRCYALIRMKEMTAENMERMNTILYDEMLMQYMNEIKKVKKMQMWKIICVDKITPEFRNYVENTPQITMTYMKVNIGFDFGERKVYVANQTEGLGILTYKDMRKDFISLMMLEKE